jgi:hypothetical protein
MSTHRRTFLRGLGFGLLGSTALVLPGVAQAGLFRRRGGGVCCQPVTLAPEVCAGESDAKSRFVPYDVIVPGKLTVSYPVGGSTDPTNPRAVFGNGAFAAWGWKFAGFFDSVVLLDPTNHVISAPATDITSALGIPWGYAFKGLPVGQTFQLVFKNGGTVVGSTGWYLMAGF